MGRTRDICMVEKKSKGGRLRENTATLGRGEICSWLLLGKQKKLQGSRKECLSPWEGNQSELRE